MAHMPDAYESRIRYLEQLTQQLNSQLKVMKQLVTTEVSDLKGTMQQQVAEIKSIVMHQDSVYQERVRRLEARVEQLSEFSMQLARSRGVLGSSQMPGDFLLQAPAAGSPQSGVAAGSLGGASPRGLLGDDEEGEVVDGVQEVLNQHKDELDKIYQHYTESAIEVFHPSLNLAQFTRFIKDCKLYRFGDPDSSPPELLWMSVIRRLGVGKRRGKAASFSRERLQDIPRELFADALVVLSEEKYGRLRADQSPRELLLTFLTVDVFPNVTLKMQSRSANLSRSLLEDQSRGVENRAVSVLDYDTPAVRNVVKDYKKKLQTSFTSAVRKVHYSDDQMNIDGFVEFCREHGLMPLVTKPDMRKIFFTCAQMDAPEGQPQPSTIYFRTFIKVMYHMAEKIYGDPLYVDKYPTPEARMRKLMAKMYLLHA